MALVKVRFSKVLAGHYRVTGVVIFQAKFAGNGTKNVLGQGGYF